MRLFDVFTNARREAREADDLASLSGRLGRFAPEAQRRGDALCETVIAGAVPDNSPIRDAVWSLLREIVAYEEIFTVTRVSLFRQRDTAETWQTLAALARQLAVFEEPSIAGH